MKIKPMLGDWEIPRIASIESLERRNWVEMPVPGKVGSIYQDLNTQPTRLALAGSLYGDEARDAFLEEVRAKYQAGEAVTFTADILTATEVQYVIIESLLFEENANLPDETSFAMVLRESPPPPPPTNLLGDLDTGLLDMAGDFLDSLSGALDLIDSLGNIPDIGDPTPPIKNALSGVTQATSGLSDTLSPLTDIFGDAE